MQVKSEESKGIFETHAEPSLEAPAPEDTKSEEPKDAEAKVEIKEEAKPKPTEGPVSKWTLVDYDDESAAYPEYAPPSLPSPSIGTWTRAFFVTVNLVCN